MITLNGKGACSGIVFGRLCFYRRGAGSVERTAVEDPETEVKRFEAARGRAVAELAVLYDKTAQELGEESSLLFQIHQMMLEDLDYCDAVTGLIRQETVNAEYAVQRIAQKFEDMFADMDDEYLRGRAADVQDVSRRVLSILTGVPAGGIEAEEPVIVAADDLAPSETVQLDKGRILAFVTVGGSVTSHAAILARTMGIPAVIGLGSALSEELEGREAAVDGSTGEVYLEPDRATCSRLRVKARREAEYRELMARYRGRETVTRDGRKLPLYANIDSLDDMEAALQNDAEGVGLFRSEFLYLESRDYPSEERQFQVYKRVAEKMDGRRVVIRTLDIGADKQAAYFRLPAEENPAMGMRAIRLCLTRPEIFKTQLRALYRASAYGRIAILFPLITSVQELREVKRLAAGVREELAASGVPFDPGAELGIMIETPAAAVISDQLAKMVDFFSVGTNDLIQYTLAADRRNESVAEFADPHHEAILRLIGYSAKSAHEAGIWIGICGELGADQEMTRAFLEMGIDELSVSPPAILPLRARICQIG
ncbi:MAG: phosphoenolpyruvate--protein phosphotransferase [Clostridiales bacterium]|nr:phosphoenolpyruvate--protein phosphotransferase [Clostridiales bacterium]